MSDDSEEVRTHLRGFVGYLEIRGYMVVDAQLPEFETEESIVFGIIDDYVDSVLTDD